MRHARRQLPHFDWLMPLLISTNPICQYLSTARSRFLEIVRRNSDEVNANALRVCQ